MSTPAACLHCLTPLAAASAEPFCCFGCRAVYGLLRANGLARYYELGGGAGRPATVATGERRDLRWLESWVRKLDEASPLARVDLDVQGLHCTGCVWLLETLFRRLPGGQEIVVNPSLGRVHLVASATFPLRDFIETVERFGYLFGPPLKAPRALSSGLVTRMGICIALAMNAMIFAIAGYAGLREGPVHMLFARTNLVLGFLSVVVGGSVFIKGAWQGIRRGVLHLDLPIAVGILLAFAGSVQSYAAGSGRASFVDTLTVFIALMLVGRFLQERVIERNRLALLESDGTDGLRASCVRNGSVETIACCDICEGDRLVLAAGDLLPVDARLAVPCASFSLDWINGESEPHVFREGDEIPAGAFHAGADAVEVEARTAFDRSPLVELLRAPLERGADRAMSTGWWRRFAKAYVALTLAAAAAGFVAWLARTGDARRAGEVATAVLMVTCPCAFGIAVPLANELVCAGLRRAGLFVRSPGFLERAAGVTTVVFDKTGTITTGSLALADSAPLVRLTRAERSALSQIVLRSHHPKSLAVKRALGDVPYAQGARVREQPGLGLELEHEGARYRLGAPSWAAAGASCNGDLAFGVDGRLLADLTTLETRRADAAAEIGRLRDRGYDVWLLSGDVSARVVGEATSCGLPESRAIGGMSASGKAEWARARDRGDLLMVGDGINDSLAVESATCSGTPAIDRPFMAARSDFYFVSPGLRPIRVALDAARKLADVRRRNLSIAVVYNAVAVLLAWAGVMSPLVCAITMPASSLTTILSTIASLSPRSAVWRS